MIDLAELTAKGPVLVRLTCGCSGCDKELAYFQAIHEAYKDAGLTTLAVFKEPDAKVAAYVKEKKLNMLYAVDTKGESWNVFETKTMPTNFLIDKGGKIVAIAAGCGQAACWPKLSEKVAKTVQAKAGGRQGQGRWRARKRSQRLRSARGGGPGRENGEGHSRTP